MDPEVLPKDRDFHAELSLEATKGSLQCSGSNRTPQHCTLGGPTSWQEWSASRSLSGDAESPFDLLHADLSVSPKAIGIEISAGRNQYVCHQYLQLRRQRESWDGRL